MRFLLDHDVPADLALLLRSRGYEAARFFSACVCRAVNATSRSRASGPEKGGERLRVAERKISDQLAT